jgi:hypothetical protein
VTVVKTARASVKNIEKLVFVIKRWGLFRVRTKFLNNIHMNTGLKDFYTLKVERSLYVPPV